jgi:hypothetical protein
VGIISGKVIPDEVEEPDEDEVAPVLVTSVPIIVSPVELSICEPVELTPPVELLSGATVKRILQLILID